MLLCICGPLTFEDDLQLVPEDVEGAVSGGGLRDDVLLQPATTGVLVEVVTWFHTHVHVLQETRGCTETQRRKTFMTFDLSELTGKSWAMMSCRCM